MSRGVRAAVLGAGSWGTAFAKVLADAGTDVTIWARREAVAAAIREYGTNPDYLPAVRLPDAGHRHHGRRPRRSRTPTWWCSPCRRRRCAATSPTGPEFLAPDATLVSLMKGIELGTTKRMSEVIVETAQVAPDRVVVVSGPNLAAEIAAEQPAATVVACTDIDRADRGAAGDRHAVPASVHQRRRRSAASWAAR